MCFPRKLFNFILISNRLFIFWVVIKKNDVGPFALAHNEEISAGLKLHIKIPIQWEKRIFFGLV